LLGFRLRHWSDAVTASISIETTTGTIGPKPTVEFTFEDVLALRRLPANLFQAYLHRADGQFTPVPMDTLLSALPADADAVLRCIMNPNFSEFLEIVVTRYPRENAVTVIQDVQFGRDGCEKTVYEIDPETARSIVGERVRAFFSARDSAARTLVGVSGGGDSNALIGPLRTALSERGGELVAYTLVCEPIWPEASAERAAAICRAHGVEHLVLDGPRMSTLVGLKTDVPTFHDAFLARYGRNTAHFFATYMISAVARRLCDEHGATDYCLGFNREDVLAEMLFSVLNGRRPLEFPVRRFGGKRLLMPVWDVPKLVLDACYPEFSRQNYEHRISTTPQRGLIYFLAHALDGLYNNLGLSLMAGMAEIFAGNWPVLQHDADFDLYVEDLVGLDNLEDTKRFLAEHVHPRTGG
jgi:hypothetical protein